MQDRNRSLPQVLLLLGAPLYILLHYLPRLSIYDVLNDDYHNVLPVIHKIYNPQLFPESAIVDLLTKIHTESSYLYYYGLAYPLSHFFHPSTTMKVLGIMACLLFFYFSGFNWKNRSDIVRAIFFLLIILHADINTIMQGNRRSFRAVFLMGLLWCEERQSFPMYLLLLAFATGIYPPVAVLLLGYRWIDSMMKYLKHELSLGKIWFQPVISLVVFLVFLGPYLWGKFTAGLEFSRVISTFSYSFSSIYDFFEFFLIGTGNSQLITYSFLVCLLGLLSFLEILVVNKKNLKIRNSLIPLILSAVSLWALAHLVHPTLYQPNRYTWSVFFIVTGIFFLDNLPATLSTILPNRFKSFRNFGGGIFILILILSYYPHCLFECTGSRHQTQFQGLYKSLQKTPLNTRVAGPPQWMDWILAFGKRNVYNSGELTDIPFVCSRNKNLTLAYYSSEPETIIEFMRNEGLDFLLVDRKVLDEYVFSACGVKRSRFNNPVLNREFKDFRWQIDDMVYLLDRNQLKKQL